MPTITNSIKQTLSESLYLYYSSVKNGDLETLSTLMTQESYYITLESLGFKRAFKDAEFKKTLKNIDSSKEDLHKAEEAISQNLRTNSTEHDVNVTDFESNGNDRITLHYSEDENPKKMYFSDSSGKWKIDYKAGRKLN